MKANLVLTAVLGLGLLALPAHAEEAANIHMGNMEVGGSASLKSNKTASGSLTTISIQPTVQYFLIDHFSVGAAAGWSHDFSDSGTSSFNIGPAATYYFMVVDKLAPFVSDALLYTHTGFNGNSISSSGAWTNALSVGVDYFFNPFVALGPALQWSHAFPSDGGTAANTYSIVANFHMYL